MLALLMAAAALQALSQEDNGPILRPRVHPAKPSGATLLVLCDLACEWKLDGEAKGRIEAGGSAKAKVELGQHFVVAVTEDGVDQVKQFSEVKSTGQTAISLELVPVRDARLKAEKEARDKAEAEAKAQTEREAREKAEQEARVRAASEQIERELQQQRNRATELANRGYRLYSYPEDGFSAYFPRTPGMQTKNIPTQTGSSEMHQYSAEDSSTALMVFVNDYGAQLAGQDPEMVLERVKKGALTASKSRLLNERKITLGGHPGLEFESESATMHFSVRYYLVGSTLYQTMVVALLANPYADAAQFHDSFQLIDRVPR